MGKRGNTTSYLYLGGRSGRFVSLVTINSSLEDFELFHYSFLADSLILRLRK